jgi:hypothetical protein
LPRANKVKCTAGYGPRFLIAVPEFLDQFSRKQAQKHYFSVSEKELFWLVFTKTGSINSGTGLIRAEKTRFWDSAVKTFLQVSITKMNQNDKNDNNYYYALLGWAECRG